jgi:molybdate transport system regulatory protein
MNKLDGHISKVQTSGELSLVSVSLIGGLVLKAIVIDTPATAAYLCQGSEVKITFKETEVVLGTPENHKISLQNRITGTIIEIEKGQLLSRVRIQSAAGEICSVVSSNAVEQLQLKEKAKVCAMIKLNETMLAV